MSKTIKYETIFGSHQIDLFLEHLRYSKDVIIEIKKCEEGIYKIKCSHYSLIGSSKFFKTHIIPRAKSFGLIIVEEDAIKKKMRLPYSQYKFIAIKEKGDLKIGDPKGEQP